MTFPEFFARLMRIFLRMHGSLALVFMCLSNHLGLIGWHTAPRP